MPKCQICGEYTYLSPICKKCAKQIIVDETEYAMREATAIEKQERLWDEPDPEEFTGDIEDGEVYENLHYNSWSRANREGT